MTSTRPTAHRSQTQARNQIPDRKGKKETTRMLAPIYRRTENLAPASGRNIFPGRFLKSLFQDKESEMAKIVIFSEKS